MIIRELDLSNVFEIIPEPKRDERGFFMRVYDHELFGERGFGYTWIQENHSRTVKRGVIRGLHFQLPPSSETKLVRCVRGAVYDVAVDLRKGSATFGKWIARELSEENMKMLLIPKGFAHGFCSLTDLSEVIYKVDAPYSPEQERGIIWNDADLNILWPAADPVLSDKDRKNMTLKEYLREIQKG